jgi:hypothetical protein
MKKRILYLIVSTFFVGALISNVSISNKENGKSTSTAFTLSSLMQKANAQVELPPVEIICSAGNEGQCFQDDCVMEWTPFGPFWWTECDWTGYMSDFCALHMPC